MLRRMVIGSSCISIVSVLCVTLVLIAAPNSSPVADAAMQGDREAVRSLLKKGIDVNAPQGDGMTALHWAASNDDAQMAQMLIYGGANLKAATRVGGYTALLLASKNGNAQVIGTLLKAGADANSSTSLAITPLMLAAASGSTAAVKELLEHGANVNAQESARGQTALVLAAAGNRADVIRLLISHGANPKIITKTSVPPEFVKDGMENRIVVPKQYKGNGQDAAKDRPATKQTADEVAINAIHADAGTVSDLTRKGPQASNNINNPDVPGRIAPDPLGGLTPLHYAVREGHLESVLALLDGGANINQVTGGDKTSPLLIATLNGQFDLAKLLLEHGADPNLASLPGTTPLYATLNIQWAHISFYPQPTSQKQQRTTHVQLIKELLDHGADPNFRLKKSLWYSLFNSFGTSGISEAGATSLWRAAQSSDIEAMRLLVARGADWKVPNDQGITPLNVAAGSGWRGVLNVNAPTGWMPALEYLVDLGADVNGIDTEGFTPLHSAAERGDNQMILYLLSKGADIMAVTKSGITVADMANGPRHSIQPFPETVNLLVLLGAKNSHRCISC